MAEDQTPAVIPAVAEWELRNARTRQVRVFEQTELSIEGEARLVGLARKVRGVLDQTGYSWDQIGDVLSNEAETNWGLLFDLITRAAEYAPDLIADLGTILLGVYPTHEDGTPNPAYETDRTFLRNSLNLRVLVEMIRTFIEQNDYRRLMAPFGMTLTGTMAAFRGSPAGVRTDTGAPSSDGVVVGIDGSPIVLEPDGQQPDPIPPTSEATGSDSATPSGPS